MRRSDCTPIWTVLNRSHLVTEYVRLVICIEGFLDLLIVQVKPVFMSSDLCPQYLSSRFSEGIPERKPFSGAAFLGQILSGLFVNQLLKLEKVGRIFQPGNVVRNLNSLGSASVKQWYLQRQYDLDQAVVSLAFSTPHGASDTNISDVALAYNDEVNHSGLTSGVSRWFCIYQSSWAQCWKCRGLVHRTCRVGAGHCQWPCLMRVCQEPLASRCSRGCSFISLSFIALCLLRNI